MREVEKYIFITTVKNKKLSRAKFEILQIILCVRM